MFKTQSGKLLQLTLQKTVPLFSPLLYICLTRKVHVKVVVIRTFRSEKKIPNSFIILDQRILRMTETVDTVSICYFILCYASYLHQTMHTDVRQCSRVDPVHQWKKNKNTKNGRHLSIWFI